MYYHTKKWLWCNCLKTLNLDEGEILAEEWIEDMLDNIDGLLDLDVIEIKQI